MAAGSVSTALKRAIHQLLWVYLKWLLVVGFITYAATGVYKIDKDAIGVLTRFGKVVEPQVLPGLHYKLPWPIDRIDTVLVKQVRTLLIQDFGSRYSLTEGGKSYAFYKNTNLEPYCLTGDNNIIAITLALKYTVDDPVKYLFKHRNPGYYMDRSAARLIVHHLARLPIDEVLTQAKKQLEFDLQKALVQELEKQGTGIRLSFLEIKEIKPPKKVQEDFDRVINAEVKKKNALHQAQGYLNRVVPKARTQADKIIQEAKAYKQERILAAEGETARFLSRLKGFNENPQAHRQKIYLEFIKNLYPKLKEIRVVDARGNGETTALIPLKPRGSSVDN